MQAEVIPTSAISPASADSDSDVQRESASEGSGLVAVDSNDPSEQTSPSTANTENSGGGDEEEDFRAMACGRDGVSLAQKLHDEFLVCKICLEDFRNPKCLECMHTFCEQCIENHVFSETSYKKYSDYREFTCPLCRKRSQMPFGGIRKLPDNHLVSGLMTSVRRRRPLSHCLSVGACDVCRGPISSSAATSSAPARCLDCCKSLCPGCAAAHRQTPVTAGHSLYDPDLVSAVLQDPDALSCLEHRNETVAYYCSDCERCVCVLCTFDCIQPGQPHYEHDIIDFNAAVARYEKSLREQSGRAASEADRLQYDLNALTACADDVETVRRQIRATAEALRRQLDTDEANLLRRVDQLYSDECRRAVDARPALRDRVDRLREVGRRVESVLGHRGVELLLLKKVISDQLEKEERTALDQPSAQLPDAFLKAVEFVPGSASVGELRERHGGRIQTAGGGPRSCSAADCRCLCHLQRSSTASSTAVAEVSTNTQPPALADKAVNTKARGLINQNGGGGGGGGRRTSRTTSVEMVLSSAAPHEPQKQEMKE